MPTILVAEDEPMVRMSIVGYLEDSGFNIEEASDGEEAIVKIKELEIDVVITDLEMPKISGDGVILFCSENYPEIPIIVVSASVKLYPEYEKALSIDNVKFTIEKPVDLAKLEEKLREVLKAKQSKQIR